MQHPCPKREPARTFSLPFLDHLFRTRHLKRYAARARSGDPEAARLLARQYSHCPDGMTENLLCSLLERPVPVIANVLCQEALESGDDLLASLIRNHHVMPEDLTLRALFFFTTGRIAEYRKLDSALGFPLLRAGYRDAQEQVRERVRTTAIRFREESLLADAILNPDLPVPSLAISKQEWEIIVAGLISTSRFSDLYHLLLDAPVPYALTAVRAMRNTGWSPEDKFVCRLWDRVAAEAPEHWTYPEMSAADHRVLEGPGMQTRSLQFSPDGSYVLSTGYDGSIRIWDVRRGEQVSSFKGGGASGCPPVFFPDGTGILTCSDGTLVARAVPSGCVLFSIPGCRRDTFTVVVSHYNRMLAYTRADGKIGIALLDGRPVTCLDAGDAPVLTLAFSTDGKTLACGSEGGVIRLLIIENGTVRWKRICRSGKVRCLSFSNGRNGIFALADKADPELLDEKDGVCIRVFETPSHRPRTGSVSADGCWVFVTCEDDSICIFNAGNRYPVGVIPARKGGAASASFIPEHKMVITGGTNGIVRTFRFNDSTPELMFNAHADWVHALSVSPDGKLLASAGWDGTIKLWQLPEGSLLHSLTAGAGTVTCIAASGDGNLLACGTNDGRVRLWRLPDGVFLATIDAFTGSVRAVAVNIDGSLIATAGTDATIRIWERKSGLLVTSLAGLKNITYNLAFTPDGMGILAGGWDESVRLFRLPKGDLIRTFPGHKNVITGIAVAGDGKRFVSGSFDGTCRIWDLSDDSGSIACTATGVEIDSVTLSPDGTTIAAAGKDTTIRIFDEKGICRFTLTGAPSRVTGLIVSPGDDLLVASGDDGSITYFSLRHRSHIRNFSAHAGKVCGLACIAGGSLVASAGMDGTVRLIPLPHSSPLSSANPDLVPVVAREAHDNLRQPERQQWNFLLAILSLKLLYEIGLCIPPPSVGEFDIMIVE